MSTRNYLLLCAGLSAALVLALLYVPGFSDTVEGLMLLFLSTNAR